MEIIFADSFWKSLKKLKFQNMWHYKIYSFFRYDIWWFFRNMYNFRKELYHYRDFDSIFSLIMFKRSLELLCNTIEFKGHEIDETRLKKVAKLKRVIEILGYFEKDSFTELAEKQLGFEYDYSYGIDQRNLMPKEVRDNNGKIIELSMALENSLFQELLDILKGQDREIFQNVSDEEYYELFDGSGIQGWWD